MVDVDHARAAAERAGLHLQRDAEGLVLKGDGMELRGDFTRMLPRLRPDRLSHELLVRAVRFKHQGGSLLVVDATAGLGDDALLLAAAGCEVVLFERDPVIAALLDDALHKAQSLPGLAEPVTHMHMAEGDSVAALSGLVRHPDDGRLDGCCLDGWFSDGWHPGDRYLDVVYLDPMFPPRAKSAAVKKKLQLLQRLEQPCEDEKALLTAALGAHPRKVIIKRPAKGPYLADVKPSYALDGKAIRFDVILPSPDSARSRPY